MTESKTTQSNAVYFVLLLVPLFWGGAFAVTRHVVTELPPLATSAIRFILAGPVLAAILFYKGGWDWPAVRRNWVGLLCFGATGVFLFNLFFSIGLQHTSAINAALVVVVNPVLTALVAVVMLGEPWSWRLVAGVILSFFGVLITVARGSLAALQSLSFSTGDIILVGAIFSWTAYTTIGKIVMKKVPTLLATTVSTLMGAVMLIIASLFEGGWAKTGSLSGQVMLELFYLGIFATVVAFIIYNTGIKRIGASRASAYINLMPVNAIWIAAVFYGETVTVAHLTGAALIIGGLLLITIFDRR